MTVGARSVVALLTVAAVAVLVWLLFFDNGDDNGSETPPAAQKTVVNYSGGELPSAVSSVGEPVYWLGAEPGKQYELTLITDGRSYVRYLPVGVAAESPQAFRTVGTYALQNPVKELERLDKSSGNHRFKVPGGGVGLAPASAPTHVYVAFPDQSIEIEVFDPHPGDAEKAIKRGELTPIR